ncbi:glycoside hydrolase family 127 protein [Streptococcus equinus]|uniref:glycoside hydrolase family 127 protein n=1 Tax=Streptococcus equinus TaxID=1335 RepID=UPI0012FA6C2A|nr:beta-L-arabinofuranosidase domain-containing protein [Streptococcus equinus]QGX46262.1 glycoside hydrolase family 127 protein [Streptococcus equinus]
MKEFDLKDVTITSPFWQDYLRLIKEKTIPYQLQVLKDEIAVDVQAERKDDSLPAGKSHAIENFKIAAGLATGEHFGWFFQDSDVYKWIESVGVILQSQSDAKLEAKADEVIAIIEQAQEDDGYLDTYFQLKFPKLKYRQLYFSHELYCAGHLIEAAIAYDKATGKDKLLQVAKRFVSNISEHFGYGDNQIQGADGHQEIELALVKLYDYTKDESYLRLAQFFIDVRGKNPDFYREEVAANLADGLSDDNPTIDLEYLQAYTQPKHQKHAVGHAVRMLYMATGMSKIVARDFDAELYQACLDIWDDIVHRKMYVTGGVGSTVHGEAFVGSYDLPNDTMYCETCASIALLYFAYELFQISPKAEYIDVMERVLYNGILSGASADGKRFFYVNPLEVDVDSCHHNPGKGHVKTQRPDWLGCACCPPNFARTIGSIGRYIYLESGNELFINLYIASQLKGNDFVLEQKTDFPFGNKVEITYSGVQKTLYLQEPYWAKDLAVTCENAKVLQREGRRIKVYLEDGAHIVLHFGQPVLAVHSNPEVRADIGKVAIQKGPFIYCAQAVDNPNLKYCRLDSKLVNQAHAVKATKDFGVYTSLTLPCQKVDAWQEKALYQFDYEETSRLSDLVMMPYYLWGNQGETDMQVWFPEVRRNVP